MEKTSINWNNGNITGSRVTTKLRVGEIVFFRKKVYVTNFITPEPSWDKIMMITFIGDILYLFDVDEVYGKPRLRKATLAIIGWAECGYASIHSYPSNIRWSEVIRDSINYSISNSESISPMNDKNLIASIIHMTSKQLIEDSQEKNRISSPTSFDLLASSMYNYPNIRVKV